MKPVLEQINPGMLTFDCPGCGVGHAVYVGGGPGPRWAWNDSLTRPTFSPSLLVQWDALPPDEVRRVDEHFAAHGRFPDPFPARQHYVCHSFITDGQIQFLGDCTHALANQTVPLPAIED